MKEASAAPTRTFVLRCGSAFAATIGAALICGGAVFAAPNPDPAPQRKVPGAVKKLWSEYPLNAGRPGRTEQPAAQPQTPPPATAAANDDGWTGTTRVLLTIAVSMLGLSIVVFLLLRHRIAAISLRGVPPRRLALPAFALARPADSGPRIPPKGGHTMSYFRRLRGSGSDDESGAPNFDAESSAEKFTAYSLRAASDNSPGRPAKTEASQDRAAMPEPVARVVEGAAGSPYDPAVYEQLGEHVSTVLSSADEAAKRLQASATKEAERIRGEAEDYARKSRAAADAYAEQRREGAETQASAITADAEKRAREVRNAAEEQATDIQRDAIRRREALLQESERSEERLRNLLKVFRAMTERLENLVSTAEAAGTETAATSVDDDLTEALAESRGARASRAGGSRAARR